MTKSILRKSEDSDGISFTAEFEFSYAVGGVEYRCTEHTHGRPLNDAEAAEKGLVTRFPVGSSVYVHVDPGNPSVGVLDTGFPYFWNAIRRGCAALMVVGVTLVLYGS